MRLIYDGVDTFEDGSHKLKVFRDDGVLLRSFPCRNDSVGANAWKPNAGCPPGTYTIGPPLNNDPSEPSSDENDWVGEGRFFIPVNNIPGHDGIGIHGGGSCSEYPLAPKQGWCPTLNCFRMQNQDLALLVADFQTNGVTFPLQFQVIQDEG